VVGITRRAAWPCDLTPGVEAIGSRVGNPATAGFYFERGRLLTEHRAYKVDAQAFDEIRIITVPRYKTSGLSGDEWRISATIQFYRNGTLQHCEGMFCDQEGCRNTATVKYRLKNMVCNQCGLAKEIDPERPEVRMFCDEHKQRGDSSLEDADNNYVQVTFLERG
jgi:hypothetical protein